MDPYIGQKLVSHKQTEMCTEARSERLNRLASIGTRALWRSALDGRAATIQRVRRRPSIANPVWIIEHLGVLRRVPERSSRPWSPPADATGRHAEGELGGVAGTAGVVTLDR